MELAVVLIRGRITVDRRVKDTLDQLGLHKKHHCVVVTESKEVLGRLQRIKDYCAWGPVNAESVSKLKAKSKSDKKIIVALHPPRGGYRRKGIKVPFTKGGALGKRDQMDALLGKMI